LLDGWWFFCSGSHFYGNFFLLANIIFLFHCIKIETFLSAMLDVGQEFKKLLVTYWFDIVFFSVQAFGPRQCIEATHFEVLFCSKRNMNWQKRVESIENENGERKQEITWRNLRDEQMFDRKLTPHKFVRCSEQKSGESKVVRRVQNVTFYLPHMEYEGSIGFVSRKMKKNYFWFSHFRTFYG
jgi:hypothetical protein